MKIDKKIVGYSVKSETDTQEVESPAVDVSDKSAFPKPVSRPEVLYGTTLRIRANGFNVYMTVNCDTDGRPLELFFSSSHLESMAWAALATRLSSVILRSHDPHINTLEALAKEYIDTEIPEPIMAKVFGAKKGTTHNGIIQLIGRNLRALHRRMVEVDSSNVQHVVETTPELAEAVVDKIAQNPCPECGEEMKLLDGCMTCVEGCGYSKCG